MPRSTLIRLTVVGLSACVLAPATAAAVPAIDGQAVAAGGGLGVTPQTLSSRAHTGGSDAVSGGGYTTHQSPKIANVYVIPATGGNVHSGGGNATHQSAKTANVYVIPATGGNVHSGGGNTIPKTGTVAPQPPSFPTNTKALPVPPAKSTDDGIDTGVLIALGAAALLAIGGLGLVMATRTRTSRRRQPA